MTHRDILAAGLCLAVGGCCCGRSDWTRYTIRPDAARPALEGDTRVLRMAAETAAGAVGGFKACGDPGDWVWAAVRKGTPENSPEWITVRVAGESGEPFVEIVHAHAGPDTWYYRCHPAYEKLQAAMAAGLRSYFGERVGIASRKNECSLARSIPPPLP